MLFYFTDYLASFLTCQMDLFTGSQGAVNSSYYSNGSRASMGVNGMGGMSSMSSMSGGWGM